MSDQEPRRCRAAAISVSTSCAYVVPSTRSVRPMMVWMCLGAMRPSRRHSATRGSRSRSATARVRMPSPAPWLTDRTAEMRAAQCVVRSATARVRMPSPAPWLTDRTAEMRAAQCVVASIRR
ncbi:hypothetical protein ASG64_02315 [Rhodococcus sp. Leaf247]|nr:hypothetical protein ASG64_02315 [Rhodococcus sp. Leaf247]